MEKSVISSIMYICILHIYIANSEFMMECLLSKSLKCLWSNLSIILGRMLQEAFLSLFTVVLLTDQKFEIFV